MVKVGCSDKNSRLLDLRVRTGSKAWFCFFFRVWAFSIIKKTRQMLPHVNYLKYP